MGMKTPSKKQILKASERCQEVKEVMQDLFPQAFEEEWVDITEDIKWKVYKFMGGDYWLMGKYYGGSVDIGDGQFYFCKDGFRFNNISHEKDFKIEYAEKVSEAQGFRILKRQ